MIEVVGNLWYYTPRSVIVITTNGTIKRDGTCVMGRGCARQARDRWPLLPKALGDHLKEKGNVPAIFTGYGPVPLVSFPVKHEWHEEADPALIQRSAVALSAMADAEGWDVVVMPRPGCGNGSLTWCSCINEEGEHCSGVKHILAPILDNRFHVITF